MSPALRVCAQFLLWPILARFCSSTYHPPSSTTTHIGGVLQYTSPLVSEAPLLLCPIHYENFLLFSFARSSFFLQFLPPFPQNLLRLIKPREVSLVLNFRIASSLPSCVLALTRFFIASQLSITVMRSGCPFLQLPQENALLESIASKAMPFETVGLKVYMFFFKIITWVIKCLALMLSISKDCSSCSDWFSEPVSITGIGSIPQGELDTRKQLPLNCNISEPPASPQKKFPHPQVPKLPLCQTVSAKTPPQLNCFPGHH